MTTGSGCDRDAHAASFVVRLRYVRRPSIVPAAAAAASSGRDAFGWASSRNLHFVRYF
jgi:hypothetical protein